MIENQFSEGFITVSDIYLAYRKAKSEAYYNSMHPTAVAFAEYESNLEENLDSLFKKLTSDSFWFDDSNFLGGYLYIPKSIDDSGWNNLDGLHYRSVDPILDWTLKFQENNKKKLEAKYRLIITPTVDYHIISALWILKVGHVFDEKLDQSLSYGNRLRRRKHPLEDYGNFNGPINEDSTGLFTPYFSAYRKWRENGLEKMREMVDRGKNVTAITMDLAGFYHNTSPQFLLRPSFLSKLGAELTDDQKAFTFQLLDSINTWYISTPDYKERPAGALPVGLSASKVISNVLLFELDDEVKKVLKPVYYGRYVDDIFLVLKSPNGTVSGRKFIEYLSDKVDCLKIDRVKDQPPGLTVRFSYAKDSQLKFTPGKQKIFSISSDHGVDLIEQISSQIREQSSEYRLLPQVPESASEMADKTLLASNDASLIADVLRKADAISVRRLGLSLLIGDIEAYSRDLRRDSWTDLRSEFYLLVFRHLINPKQLFDLYAYLPRIMKLMVSNYDFSEAKNLVVKVREAFKLVGNTTIKNKGASLKLQLCERYFCKLMTHAVLQASTTRGFDRWLQTKQVLLKLSSKSNEAGLFVRVNEIKEISKKLLLSDLGSRPYKDYWYYSQKKNIPEVPVPNDIGIRKVLRLAKIRAFRKAANLKRAYWPALVFPTRPLTIQEIALIVPDVISDSALFEEYIYILRGARTFSGRRAIKEYSETDSANYYHIPNYYKEKAKVAVTNYLVKDVYYYQALSGKPNRSLKRYQDLNLLINNILSSHTGIDYVLLPEVSIPKRWAVSIATKLASQRISLICGIEPYPHVKGGNILRNDCMLSLMTRWPGYPSSLLFLQPKLLPAHDEKKHLEKYNREFYSISGDFKECLPIYNHNGFHFGVLICSDLTNPVNRVHFQGKVDALFVLEFNPDLKTFNFLVESAAHDINTFIVQVNNRQFGDSRIRAPYRKEYKRDSIRIKGGLQDYSVVGEIDFMALRRFQSLSTKEFLKPEEEKDKVLDEFKPLPVGFKLSGYRKIQE